MNSPPKSEARTTSAGSNGAARRRGPSFIAPNPVYEFGPCGRIFSLSALVATVEDPASVRLAWNHRPSTVLVIKNAHDTRLVNQFKEMIDWLTTEKHMTVYVESSVIDDGCISDLPAKEQLLSFQEGKDDLTEKVDIIICLGGDGTLLYASSLFQTKVPPVMAFHFGSLGFLTPFDFQRYREEITRVLDDHPALTLRSRLSCKVFKQCASLVSDEQSIPNIQRLVLNDVVIERGPFANLAHLDLFIDGKFITSVQGDGLIVSTSTGSTAYAVAAGASMVHPSVSAILITPICPHSLSFRPIIVPAGVELKVMIPREARCSANVSFDGRSRTELKHGDVMSITMSVYPVPSVCVLDQTTDWFQVLGGCLHWNVRRKQRYLQGLSSLEVSDSISVSSESAEPQERLEDASSCNDSNCPSTRRASLNP